MKKDYKMRAEYYQQQRMYKRKKFLKTKDDVESCLELIYKWEDALNEIGDGKLQF